MRNINEVNAEIEQVKTELQDVHGREAEVYTRIVGYYRSVRNWNKGKREEYDHRKMFDADNPKTAGLCDVETEKERFFGVTKVELYTRATCPNCPPVIEFCKNLPIEVVEFNVDTEEGQSLAAQHKIKSAPTAILYNSEGQEIGRAHTVKDLETCFVSEPIALNA